MKLKHLGAFFLLSCAVFSLPSISHAQTTVPSASTDRMLTGWAWSSNIGWVSFNCDNLGTCLTSNEYKVKLLADGTLTGYAWSSNIGWIQFGDGEGLSSKLSGFPSGGGTSAKNATLTGSTISGWARALSAGTDGGWDGWISLAGNTVSSPVNYHNSPIPVGAAPAATAGTQGSYSVTVSGNNLNSYAWGSDVVGWLSFSGPGYGVTIVPNDPTTDPGGATTGNDCVAPDGTVIPNGTSETYYQNATVPNGSTCGGQSRMCTNGVLSGSYTNPSCSVVTGTSGSTGNTDLAPVVSLKIGSVGGTYSHGPLIVNSGVPLDVQWTLGAAGGIPSSCSVSGGLTNQSVAPLLSAVSTPTTGVFGPFTPSSTQTYTLTCSNKGGSSSDTVKAIIFSVKEF